MDDYEIKNRIEKRWDIGSKDFDSKKYDHLIRDGAEKGAWDHALLPIISAGKKHILDVGTGTGEIALLLAKSGHSVDGIDISNEMINIAKKKASDSHLNVNFYKGDAEKLPFKDEEYDVVISRYVLWTLPNPDIALNEWVRVLKKGGRIIVINSTYLNDTMYIKIKRILGGVGILLIDHDNPWKDFGDSEIRNKLPHPDGLTSDDIKKYFQMANLNEVTTLRLDDIARVQKEEMLRRYRLRFNWSYDLIYGIKN